MKKNIKTPEGGQKSEQGFSDQEISAVYRVIEQRRDMRHFKSDAIDPALLKRLLHAAHMAPSVGLMQPWRFIRVQSPATRQALHEIVEKERQQTAAQMSDRKAEFLSLKVQGILDCGEVVVVTLMDNREGHIFGRRTLPEMDLASASCAIQNMWLAARAEGIGLGWVSIFDPTEVSALLSMPEGAKAIAILCIGHVEEFYEEPMLIEAKWAERGNIDDYVMTDVWESDKAENAQRQWQESAE